MEAAPLSLFLYFLSLCFILLILYRSFRRSGFGILLLSTEFLPVAVGLCLYPLMFLADWVVPGKEGSAFLSRHGPPGIATALHIFLYTGFGVLGYRLATRRAYTERGYIFRRLHAAVRSPRRVFHALLLFGLVVYATFFYFVGIESALINAHAARSGDFSGFESDSRYLFLKTLGNLSLYAVCFIPAALSRTEGRRDWWSISVYLLLVLLAYLNSISRSVLLVYLIAPFLLYTKPRLNVSSLFKLIPIAAVTLGVLYYGKGFGFYMASILQGRYAELTPYQADAGYLNSVLQNVEFSWFSVAAGIDHFFRSGPIIPDDLIYSIFGFIPDRMLDYIGLSDYSYTNAATRLACINTAAFGLDGCTVPSLLSGYSAYLLPMVGGACFGFIRYFVLGRIEMMWRFTSSTNYRMTWIPYFSFLLAVNFLSVIPTAIAPTALMFFSAFLFIAVRRLLAAMSRKQWQTG